MCGSTLMYRHTDPFEVLNDPTFNVTIHYMMLDVVSFHAHARVLFHSLIAVLLKLHSALHNKPYYYYYYYYYVY